MGYRSAVAAVLIATAAAIPAAAQETWCKTTHSPDVVRIKLGPDCGSPERIALRRNGDDKTRLEAVTQDGGWWKVEPFAEAMGSVKLCPRVCGYASLCVAAVPKPERDPANNNKICVAEYRFDCSEPAWTLAIQSEPSATLSYVRMREPGARQSGEVKAVSIKATEMCDLAEDETVELVPKTRMKYTFAAIPVSHGALRGKPASSWTLGQDALMDFVVLPGGKRARDMTENERSAIQTEIKKLTFKIAGGAQ